MLVSSITKQADDILKMLSDSDKLSKVVKQLKKAEDGALQARQELCKAKDIGKAKEAAKKAQIEAEELLETSKKEAKDIVLQATQAAKISLEEAKASLSDVKKRYSEVEKLESILSKRLKELEKKETSVIKKEEQVKEKLAEASDIKADYQKQIEELKSRLTGIV
jgi:ribonuclease Y